MKRLYKIPCMGKVLDDAPLKGAKDNPLCPIPLASMARKQGIMGIIDYRSLNFNVDEGWVEIEVEADEEAHNWIDTIVPQLKQIATDKGFTLDTTELIKIRAERLKERLAQGAR